MKEQRKVWQIQVQRTKRHIFLLQNMRVLYQSVTTASFFFSTRRRYPVFSLTQKRQQYGIVVGHDKQVDAVESRAGLEVAKRLTEIAVLGTVANKHLKEKKKKKKIRKWTSVSEKTWL